MGGPRNLAIEVFIGELKRAQEEIRRIQVNGMERRHLLTDDDIVETRSRLASVIAILSRIDTEIANPASGARVSGGGISGMRSVEA
jgi:hypothetical protein